MKKLGWKVTHYHDGTWKVPTDAAHPGYGKREATGVEKAGDNDQMLDELRALGYID